MTAPVVAETITVGLIPEASQALADASGRALLSRTDTVNRALQLYGLFTACAANGTQVALVEPDGRIVGVRVL